MVVKEEKALTMEEVYNLVDTSEKGEEIKKFIKKFVNVKKKSEDIKKDLTDLKILKLKPEHIIKIIDFMPDEASELNKIITDVSLDQEETTKILNVVKKY